MKSQLYETIMNQLKSIEGLEIKNTELEESRIKNIRYVGWFNVNYRENEPSEEYKNTNGSHEEKYKKRETKEVEISKDLREKIILNITLGEPYREKQRASGLIFYKKNLGRKLNLFNGKVSKIDIYDQVGININLNGPFAQELEYSRWMELNLRPIEEPKSQNLKQIYKEQFKPLYRNLENKNTISKIHELLDENRGLIKYLSKKESQKINETFSERINRLLS